MRRQRKLLYFAGPLFSDAERRTNLELTNVLERWCDVFLPQRDGELITRLIERGTSPSDAYRMVFERDSLAIRQCDALVINLDGRVIDEGAAFELGFAHALRKVCVGIHTDVRVLIPWGLNPMISVPLERVFGSVELLEIWVKDFAGSMIVPSVDAVA